MDRKTLILIIEKLAAGSELPVKRYVLMTQLRAQCGWSRGSKRVFGLGWLGISRQSKALSAHDRIKVDCVQCGYHLAGLKAVWLSEVVVGPATCPECGCAYPAVGK